VEAATEAARRKRAILRIRAMLGWA
jgi:hypothetical protein